MEIRGFDQRQTDASRQPSGSEAKEIVAQRLRERLGEAELDRLPRGTLARLIGGMAGDMLQRKGFRLDPLAQRSLVTELLDGMLATRPRNRGRRRPLIAAADGGDASVGGGTIVPVTLTKVAAARARIAPMLSTKLRSRAAPGGMPRAELAAAVDEELDLLMELEELILEPLARRDLVTALVSDLQGLGPLERLIGDASIDGIVVDGHDRIMVEREGSFRSIEPLFSDHAAVTDAARHLLSLGGGRLDTGEPTVEVQLRDGMVVTVFQRSVDYGPLIVIRKPPTAINLRTLMRRQWLSREMLRLLEITVRGRGNILISGAAGAGKSSLAAALAQEIDATTPVIALDAPSDPDDPHAGEQLVEMLQTANARFAVDELRGPEAAALIEDPAMGPRGWIATIHADDPEAALSRLENMVRRGSAQWPVDTARARIAEALTLILHCSQMVDGVYRIIRIAEPSGVARHGVALEDLFRFRIDGTAPDGRVRGRFESLDRARPLKHDPKNTPT